MVGIARGTEPGGQLSAYEDDFERMPLDVQLGVTKRLVLQEGGNATCSTCHRTYNLNNVGIISKGEGGKPLYRYRVNLIGNTLIIANR